VIASEPVCLDVISGAVLGLRGYDGVVVFEQANVHATISEVKWSHRTFQEKSQDSTGL
jgi:hypothetical protein